MTTLSDNATLIGRDGFIAASGLTVTRLTSSDGDTLLVGSTPHALMDVMDERGLDNPELSEITPETTRVVLLASGQTLIL